MRLLSLILISLFALPALAAPPKERSRFYDFGNQLIDGQVMRPTAMWTEGRKRAEFGRLLKLKKSFVPAMFQTSRDPALR